MSVSEALAFDMYGTLVDPIRIWKQLEQYVPGDAQRIAEIWRECEAQNIELKRMSIKIENIADYPLPTPARPSLNGDT